MRLRKSLMKLEELNLKSITELSDLVTMGICPVKSFDHADLSNEETISNDETGEDDETATTKALKREK